MAKRFFFVSCPYENSIFKEVEVNFNYFNGFSMSQKQKCISSMHESINSLDKSLNVLEVSTKSTNPIGVSLSAFNLQFLDERTGVEYSLENIFQSSKVFEGGGPYIDLLNVRPNEAKRDERLKTSGRLKYFSYNDTIWEIEPKTMFYDWIYICSLHRNRVLSKQILNYNAFTDIEFNHEKSFNCQARSAAIYVSLCKNGKIEKMLGNRDEFKKIYIDKKDSISQISLFD